NELVLHFGLGATKGPVDLDLFWPNTTRQTVSKVSINQRVTVRFGDSTDRDEDLSRRR
ncbi:MAG TPA: hypothetical protein EYQ75_05415, partial [Planctomycetaceae bacterium]|nr:hypothetical protein [Planctomycetaceae bacterium]